MTRCNNCDADCFSIVSDGCVGYTGEAVASLEITDSMSVKQVLAKLIGGYIALADKLSKCNLCNEADFAEELTQELISLSGLAKSSTSCAATITNTSFSYTIGGNASSVVVQYSFQDIVNNLPSNFSILKKSIRVWGNSSSNTLYSSSSANSGTFSVPPSMFPIKIEFNMVLNTPCGTISLDKVVLVNGVSVGSYGTNAVVTDYGTEDYTNITQTKYNEIMRDRIINLERDLDSIKNLNVDGGTTISLPSKHIDTVIQAILTKLGET